MLFLKRSYLKHFEELSKVRPHLTESEVWIDPGIQVRGEGARASVPAGFLYHRSFHDAEGRLRAVAMVDPWLPFETEGTDAERDQRHGEGQLRTGDDEAPVVFQQGRYLRADLYRYAVERWADST